MLLGSFGKRDEVACSCSGYVTAQQETSLHSHLFGRDNGSIIISFHNELIWAASVLLLRNMTCRGDEILPLRDNQVFIQISPDEKANVYTVFVLRWIEKLSKKRKGAVGR